MSLILDKTGYEFEPSKYKPALGYARLRVIISGKPGGRFFDARALHLPTFDGRFFHPAQVTRHELAPAENLQVCLGPLSLEAYNGESLRAFSFGGQFHARVEGGDLLCELTSSAPVFKLRDNPEVVGGLIADEIIDLLAQEQARLGGHEDELYARLAKIDPYQVFLACMVSLQQRANRVPTSMRREHYHKVVAELHKAMHIVEQTDGWDGKSPSLEELLEQEKK